MRATLGTRIAVVVGAVTAGLGLWAFAAPRSFYDQLATFPPYNRHLLHDVGAFQAGLGAMLILGVVMTNALAGALWGFTVGSALHAVSHVVDRDLGGRALDPVGLAILAAASAVAAVLVARRAPS